MTMGAMAASIAHEVGQPLGALVMRAETGLVLLGKSEFDLDDVRHVLERIIDDGQRASAVLDGTRSMFRRDSSAKRAVNVNDLINEVLAVIRGELDNHQVSLQTELSDQAPVVLAGQTQLQQVMLNLVMNAVDAMKSVTNRERILMVKSDIGESGQILITVEDSGTGIDPKNRERVVLYHEGSRHGDGFGDLPLNCRISRGSPFGLAAYTKWIKFLCHASNGPADEWLICPSDHGRVRLNYYPHRGYAYR
jgi:C4-dicarboxylate-specific signal transduction histidine kinase